MTVEVIALAEAVVHARGRLTVERSMRAGVGRVFRRQAKAYPAQTMAADAVKAFAPLRLQEVAQPRSNEPLLQLVAGSWVVEEQTLAKIIAMHGARAATTAMNLTLARIGYPRATSLLPVVVDWLAAHSLERATGIEQVSMERIRNVLARGLADGKDARAIARDIRAEFTDWSKARAELIARTEVAEAWEQSQYEVLAANGWDGTEWLTAEDERVDGGRASGPCIDNAAAGVVRIGDPFPSGHYHPPAHPLCRCTGVPAFGS